MKSKFFNSSVLSPTVAASKQNSAFADGDIVFDWQGFEIPKGTAKVLGATVILRAKNDAGQTVQPAGLDLLFAKGPVPDATPTSLGTVNAEITNFASTDIIGAMPFSSNDVFGTRTLYQSLVSTCETVLEPNPNSGSTKGVDKFYVAGIAAGALDFRSGVTVDGTPGTGQANLDVADVDATLGFVAGDVVHDEDDRLMGTIASLDSDDIVMTANLANAGVNDKLIYNINPIRIILHFSK
tara:strand:- start:494 stop:1210 length:717 start_codon:yes stop_codon:yes gene_type:complete